MYSSQRSVFGPKNLSKLRTCNSGHRPPAMFKAPCACAISVGRFTQFGTPIRQRAHAGACWCQLRPGARVIRQLPRLIVASLLPLRPTSTLTNSLAVVAHIGYGTAVGAAFSLLPEPVPHSVKLGTAYGALGDVEPYALDGRTMLDPSPHGIV